MADQTMERFWTPEQLAERWQVSNDTVLRILEAEPGVLNLGNARSRRRVYRVFRCPDNVLKLIEQKRSVQ